MHLYIEEIHSYIAIDMHLCTVCLSSPSPAPTPDQPLPMSVQPLTLLLSDGSHIPRNNAYPISSITYA